MKEILKPIFEWLTGNYSLFDNPIYNYSAMAFVGFIAFTFAWNFVRDLFRAGIIESGIAGSIIHWVVRFISFVFIFVVTSIVIWIVKLVISIPIWFWWSLLGIIVLAGAISVVRHLTKNNHENIRSLN